jgi:DNA-binding PucR family transcriptional regulator
VPRSLARAQRARALGVEHDTEAHLPTLVLHADEEALADLRARALAPLADLRPATAEKLRDTLRSWLLHQGRREDIAQELFVHPQTVRYRMTQLRELYGERLEDPEVVLALTIALG